MAGFERFDVWEEIRRKCNSAAAVAPNDSGTKRQRSNVSLTAQPLHAVQQPERVNPTKSDMETGRVRKRNVPTAQPSTEPSPALQAAKRSCRDAGSTPERRDRQGAEAQATPLPDVHEMQAVSKHPMAPPTKNQNEAPGGFRYECPFCHVAVTSSLRTGQIDHRHACGRLFRVREGRVAGKAFVYVCPFCTGEITSNVKTGRIDHRSVCGNQFYVEAGAVKAQTRQYPHKCPSCRAVVWSRRSSGRIHIAHKKP